MQAVPKELLVDEEEDPQVAIEMTEIDEKEVYERIKDEYDKMSPEKQKELTLHVQGFLRSNALAHKHVAATAEQLADASRLLSTPATVALCNATTRPLVGIHLSIMGKFIQEVQKNMMKMFNRDRKITGPSMRYVFIKICRGTPGSGNTRQKEMPTIVWQWW